MAPVDKTVLVAAAAKLLTGTLIYIAIIAFARSYPGAAGMMLTFPALNGFTMALTDRQDLRNVAGVMLLMPIINCSLCAGFIYAFLWLATFTAPSLDGLLAGVSIIWAGVAAYVGTRGIGIPAHRQQLYAVLSALLLLAITAALLLSRPNSPHLSFATVGLQDFIYQNIWRIALFVGCLTVIVALTDFLIPAGRLRRGSVAGLLGTLGSFPVIPFFGLVTVAGDEARSTAERVEILRHMGTSVWLGPVVAIGFIFLFSELLVRTGGPDEASRSWANKFAFAAVGWTVCIVAIAALNLLVEALGPRP
jgi:hypothetical protein